jgi:hypothetical protein
MTKLDDDVMAVATVPGMVWEIRYKDENQEHDYAIPYKKRNILTRIFRLVR